MSNILITRFPNEEEIHQIERSNTSLDLATSCATILLITAVALAIFALVVVSFPLIIKATLIVVAITLATLSSIALYCLFKEKFHPYIGSTEMLSDLVGNILGKDTLPQYHDYITYANSDVLALLASLYGPDAAADIKQLYELRDEDTSSSATVHAYILYILANLTEEKLEKIIAHILQDNHEPNLFETLEIKKKLELASSIIDKNERYFYFINTLQAITLHTETSITQVKCPENLKHQAHNDYTIIRACNKDQYDFSVHHKDHLKVLNEFSHREFLAKSLPYSLRWSEMHSRQEEGFLIQLASLGKIECLQVYNLVKQPGLHGVILFPISIESIPEDEPVTVRLLFRGTKSLYSWERNLNIFDRLDPQEYTSPGGKSFERSKEEIMQNLCAQMKKIPLDRPIKIEIFGHSLGAADAQRMCELLSSYLDKEEDQPESDFSLDSLKIQNVDVYGFHATGIEQRISQKFLDRQYISSINRTDLSFNLYYFQTEDDIVQTAGSSRLGYVDNTESLPPNVSITTVLFKRKTTAIPFIKGLQLHTHNSLAVHTKPKNKTENQGVKIKGIHSTDIGIAARLEGTYDVAETLRSLSNAGTWAGDSVYSPMKKAPPSYQEENFSLRVSPLG